MTWLEANGWEMKPEAPEVSECREMVRKAMSKCAGIYFANAHRAQAAFDAAVEAAIPLGREVEAAFGRVQAGRATVARFKEVLTRWYKALVTGFCRALKEAA